ncbi:MAG: copper resistance CopC family protein, partial [Thermomicrobiales bacterium]
IVAALAFAVLMLFHPTAAIAGAKLDSASPAQNTRVTDAPQRLDLFFTEPLSAAAVRLFDDQGEEVVLDSAMNGGDGPNHVTVTLPPHLGNGTWTVGWNARSSMDDTATSGLYAFSIGPAPLPGSAEIDSEWPKPWAIAARWLAFFGLALAGGAFLLSRLAAPSISAPRGTRGSAGWIGAGAVGATLALLMLALVPVLAAIFPSSDDGPASIAAAFAAMPPGFLPAIIATALVSVLALVILASGKQGAFPGWIEVVGLLLALAALDGFGRMAHPGAPLIQAGAGTLHQWSSALLFGGALLLALAWVRNDGSAGAPRQFGGIAIGLALVALVTGLIATGSDISRPSELLSLQWGWTLLAKIALLLPLLGAAFLLWRTRNIDMASPPVLLRAGALIAIPALLAAAVMPLMARPGVQTFATLAELDLPAAFPMPDGSQGVAHLVMQPDTQGPAAVFVRLQRKDGSVLTPSEIPMLELTFSPLDHPEAPTTATLEPDPNGGFAFGLADISHAGWWHASLTIVPPTGDPTAVSWWFVQPDPNVTGAGPQPSSNPEAQAVFTRGLDTLKTLNSVRYTQRLTDGNGSLYQSINEATGPVDGRPAAYRELAPDQNTQQVVVGDTQWTSLNSQPWEERAAGSLYLPSQWWEVYQPATGFQFGQSETVDSEPCQVVTFYLPRSPRTAPAWYAWWVGMDTGRIRRETMVSQRHYMVYTFADFNGDIRIDAPAERKGPPAAATPSP